MTQQELLQSLSTEQGAALNVILEENFNLRGSGNEAKSLRKILSEVIAAKDSAEKALAAKNAEVAAGIATIHSIVADPETDTEKGIIAFLQEATKDERTKQREALVNQKSEIDKQLAALA